MIYHNLQKSNEVAMLEQRMILRDVKTRTK